MDRLKVKRDGRGGVELEGLEGRRVWEVLAEGFAEKDRE